MTEAKRHLVAAIGDVELYRCDDEFGCQWIRVHRGITTCMPEKSARLFFADAKRSGEVFDIDTSLGAGVAPTEDTLEDEI
jgi:hypothetical protein